MHLPASHRPQRGLRGAAAIALSAGLLVVANNLQGFTADQDNPFGMLYPENWHFSR